jgi:hypothetical protein
MKVFKTLVIAAGASLAALLYAAALVDHGLIGRLWYDLALITGLVLACAALLVGLLLERGE